MSCAIDVSHLDYAYPDGAIALHGISFSVAEGECVGIIGPNGAGKSTLLLHLNGILQSNSKSRITILDTPLTDITITAIREKVGLVFQDPENQLFMPTVFDDVAFGPLNMKKSKEQTNSLVHHALEEVDMTDTVERSSHHLSFGEKKRVSVATVLAMNPHILVLDEPSSNLDPRSRRQLIELLKKFSHTKVIASHDLEMINELCSRVLVLYEGKIVAGGPTRHILSDKSLMESYALEVPISLR